MLRINIQSLSRGKWFMMLEICPRGNRKDDHISMYSCLTKCSLNIHERQLVLFKQLCELFVKHFTCMVILKMFLVGVNGKNTHEY